MNKIVKHLKILLRRLKQYKEIERIKNYENIYLIKIVNAFLKVKKSKFNNKELDAFNRCEKYREQLLNDDTVISYKIFNSERTALVKNICKAATSK